MQRFGARRGEQLQVVVLSLSPVMIRRPLPVSHASSQLLRQATLQPPFAAQNNNQLPTSMSFDSIGKILSRGSGDFFVLFQTWVYIYTRERGFFFVFYLFIYIYLIQNYHMMTHVITSNLTPGVVTERQNIDLGLFFNNFLNSGT